MYTKATKGTSNLALAILRRSAWEPTWRVMRSNVLHYQGMTYAWEPEGACLGFVHTSYLCISPKYFYGGLHLMHLREPMTHATKQFS